MPTPHAKELCEKVKGTWTMDEATKVIKCAAPAPSTDASNTECPLTAVRCKTCAGGECTACEDGHWLDATNKVCRRNCVKDADNCTACDAKNEKCTTCASGFSLDPRDLCIKTFACEAGKLGCTTCSQANT